MFRVLRNTCIDRLRHRSRLHVAFDDSVAGRDCAAQRTPETDLLTADALMHVARALDGLPADLAETLSLVVVEGLSYQDAAFVIGRPVGTVRSRLSRARRLLRHCLHGNEPGSAEPFRRESADMSADDA